MIDVSELMTDPELTTTFTRRRPKGSFSVEGEYAASYDEDTLIGIVQPAGPEVLKMLPEGSRLDNLISVWSEESLRGADGKRNEADVLIVDGKYFRVVQAEARPDGGYSRVLAEGYVP